MYRYTVEISNFSSFLRSVLMPCYFMLSFYVSKVLSGALKELGTRIVVFSGNLRIYNCNAKKNRFSELQFKDVFVFENVELKLPRKKKQQT